MTNRTINSINAVSIKKFMKMNGIKVLRCSQNGLGVLITVCDEKENIKKAIKFFLDYGLGRKDSDFSIPCVICKGKGYADFGSLYSITCD